MMTLLAIVLALQTVTNQAVTIQAEPSGPNDYSKAYRGLFLNGVEAYRFGIAPNFSGVCLGVYYQDQPHTMSACAVEFYFATIDGAMGAGNIICRGNDHPCILWNTRESYARPINPGGQANPPGRVGIGSHSGYPHAYLKATLDVSGDIYASMTAGETSGTIYGMNREYTFTDQGNDSSTIAYGDMATITINYTGATRTGYYRGRALNVIEQSIPSGGGWLDLVSRNGLSMSGVDRNGVIWGRGGLSSTVLAAPSGQKYFVCVNDQGVLSSQASACQ